MDAFNKEIEELLAIQAQNSEALRKLSTELISLNFSLLVGMRFPSVLRSIITDEESLKKVLDSKEKSHALYCEQVMKLYKLKNEEAEHRKRIQEAISEIVPLQHRLEELEKCQERQKYALKFTFLT